MKALAIILNIIWPGIGTLVIGRVGLGIAQILLHLIGVVLTLTAIGALIGVPLCIGVWIWGIVVASSWKEPVKAQ